jgi:alpha-D-ribose 1-methylphosphonate 5-triphosphate synthase subunit PhnH
MKKILIENTASGWRVALKGRGESENLTVSPETGHVLSHLLETMVAGDKNYPKGVKVGTKFELRITN